MKAKANKRLDFIDIIDEDTNTVYRCSSCTDQDYDECWLWTHGDCKWFLNSRNGAVILTLKDAGYE